MQKLRIPAFLPGAVFKSCFCRQVDGKQICSELCPAEHNMPIIYFSGEQSPQYRLTENLHITER